MVRERNVAVAVEDYKKAIQGSVNYKKEICKLLNSQEMKNELSCDYLMFDSALDSPDCMEKFRDPFNNSGFSSGSDSYHYVWIGFTKENIPIVVGKAAISKAKNWDLGDLFLRYSLFGGVTQDILIHIIAEDKIGNLKKLDEELNDFMKSALIVLLDVTTNEKASANETIIGNKILEKKIPLLNRRSHCYR